MFGTILVTLLIFSDFELVLNFTFNFLVNGSKCSVITEGLWNIYQRHFCLVGSLTVTILQDGEHISDVNDFANQFLKFLFDKQRGYTITIKEKMLFKNVTKRKSYFNYIFSTDPSSSREDSEFAKLKLRSADPGQGHLIIAWNGEDILNLSIPRPRTPHALLFIKNCQIERTLNEFWTKFQVLDVIAQSLCSCHQNQIFIHRPFDTNRIQNLTITAISNDFHLIANALNNLNQFPVRIAIFEKVPTVVTKLPRFVRFNPIYQNLTLSQGFAGPDGLLLGVLVQRLNFNAVLTKFPPLSFGHVLPNGSVYGVFAEVVHGRTDYAINSRLMAYYRSNTFEYTAAYYSEKISVVVPKSAKVPRWRSIFTCFDKLSWILILLVFASCTVLWYFIKSSQKLVTKVLWEMFSFLMGIPHKIVTSPGQSIFLTSCMFFNVVILGIIQGSLFTTFTKENFYPEIDTLEEVVEAGFPLMSFAWLILRDNRSGSVSKLKQRSMPYDGDKFQVMAQYRNMAALDRKLDLELQIMTQFIGDDGIPLLHIVEESLASFHTCGIVSKGFPLLPAFNQIVTGASESGLISKWYRDMIDGTIIGGKELVPRRVKRFSLEDIQAAFYVIAIGYISSIAMFVGEIFWNFVNQRK